MIGRLYGQILSDIGFLRKSSLGSMNPTEECLTSQGLLASVQRL